MIPWPLPQDHKLPLFDLGKWLDSIPRPDRSGLLSVGLALAVAFSVLTAMPAGDIDLRCWLTGNCPKQESEMKPPPRLTLVYFAPGFSKGSRPCTCHTDWMMLGHPVEHLHYSPEETCDSVPREWRFLLVGTLHDKHLTVTTQNWDPGFKPQQNEVAEYEHCTDDDSKYPQ